MGTHRLTVLYPSKFRVWVRTLGYEDEYDFWSSLSKINTGTVVDHMIDYLTDAGYEGTPDDQFREFLKVQVGSIGGLEGTMFDMANELFDGGFTAPITFLSTEDGDILVGEDGDAFILE